ncbi:MAG: YkvA family protein [Methyloceanibacter sp.]
MRASSAMRHSARRFPCGGLPNARRRCAVTSGSKLKRFAGQVPFVEDLVAGYYCALDPDTPMRVRGMLLAAIVYFILPFDLIPDIIAGLGFADDAALLTAVLALVSSHITPRGGGAGARQGAAPRNLTAAGPRAGA